MSRARERRGTLMRSPTAQNLVGSLQTGQSTAYHREVIYPTLPLTLDEIYDRAAKYTDKLLARPVFYLDTEDGEDASLAGAPVPPTGASRVRRSQVAEKRMSLATSPFPGGGSSTEKGTGHPPGFERRRISTLPGGGAPDGARRLSGPVSDDYKRGSGVLGHGGHEGRRSGFSNNPNVPPSIAEDE